MVAMSPAFGPVWDSLWAMARARLLSLLLEEVDYDGRAGRLGIRFRANGFWAPGASGIAQPERSAVGCALSKPICVLGTRLTRPRLITRTAIQREGTECRFSNSISSMARFWQS